MNKTGSLSADLLASKGAGNPVQNNFLLENPAPPRDSVTLVVGTKALTVKVDNETFERLNKARYEQQTSAQEILLEGLMMWLRKNRY